uniref:Uncharacterized protein n=1 Tax=Lepeophtheirus salmonis TaxID=72036 RepID=A0A0K2VHS3_LEPSM
MFFNRFNNSFWRRKSLTTHFFLDVREEISYWVSSQGCMAEDPSIQRFGRSKRRRFEPICENSHCHGEQ